MPQHSGSTSPEVRPPPARVHILGAGPVGLLLTGEIVGDREIVRIPLDLYHARHATSREWRRTGTRDHAFTHIY